MPLQVVDLLSRVVNLPRRVIDIWVLGWLPLAQDSDVMGKVVKVV